MKLYVKNQGRIVGPLEWERIRAMYEKGRLSSDVTLSEDKVNWMSFDDVQDLIDGRNAQVARHASKKNSEAVIVVPTTPPSAPVSMTYPPPSPTPMPMGANPMGANPMGMPPMGANPMGMPPMGPNPMGMPPMGANPM